jgi:hypothetical protein
MWFVRLVAEHGQHTEPLVDHQELSAAFLPVVDQLSLR